MAAPGWTVDRSSLDTRLGQISSDIAALEKKITETAAWLALQNAVDLEAAPFGYTPDEAYQVVVAARGEMDTLLAEIAGQEFLPKYKGIGAAS